MQARAQHGQAGTTLVEMLVVLVIVSILAVVAIPMAETVQQRRAELELRDTLRTVRRAIDAFHADWRTGRIAEDAQEASDSGYPVSLDILVRGLDIETEDGGTQYRRYLRRMPENPFATAGRTDWDLIGYDQSRGEAWNREDVYDLRSAVDREALDGSQISDW